MGNWTTGSVKRIHIQQNWIGLPYNIQLLYTLGASRIMSRQYMNASKAVSAVLSGLSLKSYCNRNKIGKTEYALVCETVKYINIIETLFRMCEMSSESLEVNKGMLFVYCYELLFGKGKIQGGGAVKRRLLEREQALRSSLAQHLRDCGASAHAELLDPHFTEHAQMPVYIRINTLKITSSDGFRILKGLYPDAVRDEHIPNLVVLPPGTKRAWDHECVRSGKFIVQDKASCMPSQILGDVWSGGDIIDACAAPGNKTSHLAAQVRESEQHSNASIYACDKSVPRWELLKQRMEVAGADNVSPVNVDFLSINTSDQLFSKVKSVLVDPSCSGSGVVRSLERVYERVKNDATDSSNRSVNEAVDRVDQLRSFQIKAIVHAMLFPNVQHVVYSTCSIDETENESVVAEILRQKREWRLCPPARFSGWKRRGMRTAGLTADEAACLVRCAPADGVNGFFVALFCRIPDAQLPNNIVLSPPDIQSIVAKATTAGPENPNRMVDLSRKRSYCGGSVWKHFSKRLKY